MSSAKSVQVLAVDEAVRNRPLVDSSGILGRGAWAIADQAVFAGTNFLTTALAARWLGAQGFGAFSVAYAALLLLGTLHTAVLAEPLLVRGAPLDADRARPAYLHALLRLHILLAGLLFATVLPVAVILVWAGRFDLALTIVGLSIAAAGVFLAWLARRACLLLPTPRLAVVGGLAYLIATIALMTVLRRIESVTAGGVLAAMGIAGAIVGGGLLRTLGVRRPWTHSEPSGHVHLAAHWVWGRWSLPTSVLSWIPANLPYALMPALVGLEQVGQLRVLATVVTPMAQANVAVGQMLIPLFSCASVEGARRLARQSLAGVTCASLAYWVLCGSVGGVVVPTVFGPGYSRVIPLVWVFGGFPLLNGVAGVLQARLRASGNVVHVFVAYAASAVTAVALGWPAIRAWGLYGAVASVLAAYGVMVLTLAEFRVGKPRPEEDL
jgi:O-antigen/teichoic acid export membrane protein